MKQAAMAAAAEYTWSNAALQYEQIFKELGVKDVLNGHLEESLSAWLVGWLFVLRNNMSMYNSQCNAAPVAQHRP